MAGLPIASTEPPTDLAVLRAVDPRAFLSEHLSELSEAGLRRQLPLLSGEPGPRVTVNGREVLLLCSNNYLGLANDERVKRAARQAIEDCGTGATGSRLISGNSESYRLLEDELAQFKGAEAALVFASGYHANVGTVSALAGPGDAVFSDALNHASLIDGVHLSHARMAVYRHADPEDLERKLRLRASARRKLIVTESVFSMDGDIAPLEAIASLAEKYGALLMVDEAHATGVFGPTGAGVVEALGLASRVDVQMGTFSKALGSLGGYVAGSREMIDFLLHRARSFVFTTGLPPAVVAASREALRIARQEPKHREKLRKNVAALKGGLATLDFSLSVTASATASPILPVLLQDGRRTMAAHRFLLRHGIFVQGIRPPTVPPGASRLRVTPTAAHSEQDIAEALAVFAQLQLKLQSAKRLLKALEGRSTSQQTAPAAL